MILDASWLARGWLSVAAAASNEAARPQLCRTVRVEQYLHGLRLSATDSYMVLTTWVPERDHELDDEPGLDELPDQAATAMDPHGRAKGLLAHLNNLSTAAEKADEPPLDVRVRLNVPIASSDPSVIAFEGMEAHAVTIEHPDHERVQLETYDGGYPYWRSIYQRFKPVRTDAIALNHELVGRLTKVAKLHGPGVLAPLKLTWGGNNKAAHVLIGPAQPTVTGLIMPVKWDFEKDQPWVDTSKPDGPADRGAE